MEVMHRMGEKGCPSCGSGMGMGQKHGPGMMESGGIKRMFMILPWKIMMHAEELGMSKDQMEAFHRRFTDLKKEMIQIGCQKKIAFIDLKSAIMKEEMDVEGAEAKACEIGQLKGDFLAAMVRGMSDMRNILTEDQRKMVKKMIMDWMKRSHGLGAGMEGGEEEESEESEE